MQAYRAVNTILEVGLGDLLNIERDLPEPEPEEAELLRGFDRLSPARRDLLLKLVRELE